MPVLVDLLKAKDVRNLNMFRLAWERTSFTFIDRYKYLEFNQEYFEFV